MAKYYTDEIKIAIDEQLASPKSARTIPVGEPLHRSVNNTNCSQRAKSVFLALCEARREHNRTLAAAKMLAEALGEIEEEVPGNCRKKCWIKVDAALAAYEEDEASRIF